ncbi:hypothetical protein P9Y62_02515 [Bacillus thuringiensis]|uniref:Uncharacterized protein n=1 Tax=Bacillus thuringiensis HD-771 TaxID=1218175 RepID=A0A9W3P0Y4_BACTU|nr:hypothetical protein [Bacillus thuringiensis]AFQ19605.1 hypothetical protein BTG_31343 [Bacillus thuringiensis HD-771]MEB4892161.1 hypothetical protein [Bacillus thuringiensis]MEC2565376.1 hypothetical protein [Bacillus thuringiensis]MEC2644258.1 hypothetical protein [Bacillus thuringiensis]MEC2725597.1 hypothetical protein [Bacillus thuringiensis]
MDEPVITNLFKFVSIRPIQKFTERETRYTVIRDPREFAQEDSILFERLARKLANPEVALNKWNAFNLSDFRVLMEAHSSLVQRYEQLDSNDDTLDGKRLLQEYGVLSIINGYESELFEQAWDVLYTAECTGSDAGQRLELPMAVLRVLHFSQLVDENEKPTRTLALDALCAKPAIPIAFHNALSVPTKKMDKTGEMTDYSKRTLLLRELALELEATKRLLDIVTSTPAFINPAMKKINTDNLGESSHSQFSLSTVPSLSSLKGQISELQASIINNVGVPEEAPIPVAAELLETHLSKLYKQAFNFSNDQEFQGYMKQIQGLGTIIKDIPFFDLNDPSSAKDVDVSGRIVPLGIGDLKVVKQTLLEYVPGEVAHIENVLIGESKERKHRKLDRTETTLFTSEEETKETERDTQSTDRFELKGEVEQTIKEDLSLKAGLTVTATLGPVITTATGDLAYSTSKQNSQKNSSNFAREVVDRSVSKVQTKTKLERTTKTLNEVEEINTHGINNVGGPEHVVGIYRWVDKRYSAQIYNYGVRLLLEFIVPEPAAFYRAAQMHQDLKVNAKPPEDFKDIYDNPITADAITEGNYREYASRYNAAGITPPPPKYTYVGASIVKDSLELGKTISMSTDKLLVPEGYTLKYFKATYSLLWKHHGMASLQIKDQFYKILDNGSPHGNVSNNTIGEKNWGNLDPKEPDNEVYYTSGSVPASITTYDVAALAININGICLCTKEKYAKWQLETFDKIYTAYQALQTAYDQKVKEAEAKESFEVQGKNPLMNREIQKNELKKLCITMMTGQHFKGFNAMTDPPSKPKKHPEVDIYEALKEGPIVQFFEQAFEWEQMTYIYYPYFWGRKKNWIEVSKISDPDPLFMQFLNAGYARVVVPVPLAYKDAVLSLLQSKTTDLSEKVKEIWERPTINDPLYVSIEHEIRNQTDDLAGAKPEGKPWEFTLPTTLVWLQPDPQLPVFP